MCVIIFGFQIIISSVRIGMLHSLAFSVFLLFSFSLPPSSLGLSCSRTMQDIPMDDNGFVLYFAYGSNLSEQQLVERVGPAPRAYAACLLDYEVIFDKADGTDVTAYANVAFKSDAVAMGKVYYLTARQLAIMDDYEGVPRHYHRVAMQVKVFDSEGDDHRVTSSSDYNSIRNLGTLKTCVVYIASPESKTVQPLKPAQHYLRKLLLGGPLVPAWYTAWLATHGE